MGLTGSPYRELLGALIRLELYIDTLGWMGLGFRYRTTGLYRFYR